MKQDIHPEYATSRIVCACGRVTETRGTTEEYHVEICSHCHPFFTGKQKLVDTAGRVERFLAKYGDSEEEVEKVAEEVAERAATTEKIVVEEEEEEDEEGDVGEAPASEAEASGETGEESGGHAPAEGAGTPRAGQE